MLQGSVKHELLYFSYWVTNQDFQIYGQQNVFSQIVKSSVELLYRRGN